MRGSYPAKARCPVHWREETIKDSEVLPTAKDVSDAGGVLVRAELVCGETVNVVRRPRDE